jgi:tRNA dimethylallyltransferase
MNIKPLLAIVGPTASGKSAVALELAKRLDGEIICADSRTIYRGMDIGTAKPSNEEQAQVPHHLLDVVDPSERYTAAQFKSAAEAAIEDIKNRGKLPIMVGGTGLYSDSVLFDYRFTGSSTERDEINPRHAKEGNQSDRQQMRPDAVVYGLVVPKEALDRRIAVRVGHMLDKGLLDEVEALAEQYGWEAPGLQAIGYKEFKNYLADEQNLEETKQQIIRNTILYAKRQRTWFRRNEGIQWLDDPSIVVDLMTTKLNKSA